MEVVSVWKESGGEDGQPSCEVSDDEKRIEREAYEIGGTIERFSRVGV